MKWPCVHVKKNIIKIVSSLSSTKVKIIRYKHTILCSFLTSFGSAIKRYRDPFEVARIT